MPAQFFFFSLLTLDLVRLSGLYHRITPETRSPMPRKWTISDRKFVEAAVKSRSTLPQQVIARMRIGPVAAWLVARGDLMFADTRIHNYGQAKTREGEGCACSCAESFRWCSWGDWGGACPLESAGTRKSLAHVMQTNVVAMISHADIWWLVGSHTYHSDKSSVRNCSTVLQNIKNLSHESSFTASSVIPRKHTHTQTSWLQYKKKPKD